MLVTHVSILFPITQTASVTAYFPICHPYLSDLISGPHFPNCDIGSPFLWWLRYCLLGSYQEPPRVYPTFLPYLLELKYSKEECTKVGGTAKVEEDVNKYIHIAKAEDDSAKK